MLLKELLFAEKKKKPTVFILAQIIHISHLSREKNFGCWQKSLSKMSSIQINLLKYLKGKMKDCNVREY